MTEISSLSSVIPLIIGTVNIKFKSQLRPVFYYVLISLISEVTCTLLIYNKYYTNMVLNTFTVIESILIGAYYFNSISYKCWKSFILMIIVVYFFYAFYDLNAHLSNQPVFLETTVQSFFFIFLSITNFYYLLKETKTSNMLSSPDFWITAAFLIYFQSMLLLHLFGHYLFEYNEQTHLYELYTSFHNFFNITMYVLIAIGFSKIEKPSV